MLPCLCSATTLILFLDLVNCQYLIQIGLSRRNGGKSRCNRGITAPCRKVNGMRLSARNQQRRADAASCRNRGQSEALLQFVEQADSQDRT